MDWIWMIGGVLCVWCVVSLPAALAIVSVMYHGED